MFKLLATKVSTLLSENVQIGPKVSTLFSSTALTLLWHGRMNIALYWVLLYTQSALQSCGGGGLSSTTTSVQHPLGWCDVCHRTTVPVLSPHTSYRWRGERVIEPIKWMGIFRRPWLTRASGGNLAGHRGYTPTLYEKCHGIFNDHRESEPRFKISSERQCFLSMKIYFFSLQLWIMCFIYTLYSSYYDIDKFFI